ncbi:MAG: hypothetical protein HOH33_15200 [Verrucomicrobia bacterium]|jgi:hypothetical protein|nr:hypothetical protein [Verrucomicrobiota bacterium]
MQHSSIKTALNLFLTGMILLLCAGCSGFHRAWNQETSTNRTYPATTLEGAWEGEWLSDANGHHGRLRCLVHENEDGTYTTWYHAKYQKILGYAYAVDVEAKPIPAGYEFEGKADLGKLAGGIYQYKGKVASGNFNATYESKFDEGTFKMKRPRTDD